MARAVPAPAAKPLNARQRLFVDEYVIDMNAVRAAERAGYRPGSSTAVELMRRPHILRALDEALAEKRSRAALDADRVLAELGKIAFANIFDYLRFEDDGFVEVDLGALSRDAGAAISQVKVDYFPEAENGTRQVRRVTICLADKAAALRQIARCLGINRPDRRVRA